MHDLNILSKSNDIEQAEETYKDQLINITTHFIKQSSVTKMPDSIVDFKKAEKLTILAQKSDLDFDRIEVKERMPNPNSLIFQEHKEACHNLLKIISFRKKYLFSSHQSCISFCKFYCVLKLKFIYKKDQDLEKLIKKNPRSESTEPFIDYSMDIPLLPKLYDVIILIFLI